MSNIPFKTLLLDQNVTIEEVSKGSEIPLEELRGIKDGKVKMTIQNAIKLGDFFNIPAEVFFLENASVNHNNIGEKSNSNSGYIGTYKND
ncbi:hypothetical protein A33Q_4027 [Indibacter alkaliphilus LW1]|uniref:HTH cro/C1-type domain-containing protein n=1 Tax=Indibacter alkaliphilus (strain CCUG 57479 / KCTC 22604 / LW1) TaxID=1189612 RepID=S2CZ88_INDAL|nr:helix-turn-helix transcriptional regulator [Indibacter alkaliphilus]EOZ91934.1 hypothetical protein A33Q_4027 [Indibacter alkaliphilus LW1]